VARRERLGHRRRLVLRAAVGYAAVLERQTVGIFELDGLGPLVIDDIGDLYTFTPLARNSSRLSIRAEGDSASKGKWWTEIGTPVRDAQMQARDLLAGAFGGRSKIIDKSLAISADRHQQSYPDPQLTAAEIARVRLSAPFRKSKNSGFGTLAPNPLQRAEIVTP
jgi:hypothetical protein